MTNTSQNQTLTPSVLILLVSACLLLALSFGIRSSFGLYVKPLSEANNWGRDTITTALALQNLVWGIVAVFAGGLADKFGNVKVIIVSAILYAIGVFFIPYANTAFSINTFAGLLIGAGIAGTSFGIVLPAMARAVPIEKRQWALGVGTAAGSMGQFLIVPFSQQLTDNFDWATSLHIIAAITLAIILLAMPLAPYSGANEAKENQLEQTISQALKEAFSKKHYILLLVGFFVCGFHLAFIAIHLPSYLTDLGFSAKVGAWSLALIGLANVAGAYLSGVWSARLPKKDMLTWIYFSRAVVIAIFITLPPTLYSVIFFSLSMGFLWLATIPPTSGLVAVMFGTRYMALLYGMVFLSHQIGSFLGAFLGGYLYEQSEIFEIISTFCGQYLGFSSYGDAAKYNTIWLINIALGIFAALVHWPIREKPLGRLATTN